MAKEQTTKTSAKKSDALYDKKSLVTFIDDIEAKVALGEANYLNSLIALNHLLSQENARDLFDSKLKARAKEIWEKISSAGINLEEPPILNG